MSILGPKPVVILTVSCEEDDDENDDYDKDIDGDTASEDTIDSDSDDRYTVALGKDVL